MKKNAYPHEDYGIYVSPPRNVNKWMSSMNDIYAYSHKGFDFKDSFEKITSGWDVMEKLDFKKWMDFYQENAHTKYKSAQLKGPSMFENGHGSFVPNVDNLRASLPFRQPDMTPYSSVQTEEVDEETKRNAVKKQIQSLIGRLNSAERIATRPEVQVELKKCIDMPVVEWVSLLQQLKREIQLAPLRASSASLTNDIIWKNANRVFASGKKAAAALLIRVADGMPGVGGDVPAMNPVDSPMGGQPLAPAGESDAIQEFLKNMNGDISEVDDEPEDEREADDLAFITVQAQAAPLGPPAAPPPQDIEVSEDEVMAPGPAPEPVAPPKSNIGQVTTSGNPDAIDLALTNINVNDVVSRLEGIASLFKNRQIARQLSIVDLMMDKIGIAPYFPTLAEAMRSALESNQYCQSRVEDILAKLRGTVETPMSQELETDQESSIQEHLAKQELEERARKDRRKQIQDQEETAKLEGMNAPAPGREMVDAPAEMAGPAEVQTQPEAVRPIG